MANLTDYPRVQLMSQHTEYSLSEIAKYAHGVGPNVVYLYKD
jgi:hypothetical protein